MLSLLRPDVKRRLEIMMGGDPPHDPAPGGGGSTTAEPAAVAPAAEPKKRGGAKKKDAKPAEPKKTKPVKKEKPVKQPKADGPKLESGANVKYLGGGRAKSLKAGAAGVIKRVWPDHKYYGVEFGKENKHYHVLAGRLVEKVG